MRLHLSSVVASVALAVTSALAVAQEPASPAAEEPAGPPLYRVELIVFAYRDFDATEEHFEHEQPPPAPLTEQLPREVPQFDFSSLPSPDGLPSTITNATPPALTAPSSDAEDAGASSAPAEQEQFSFRLLTPAEYQLDGAYQTLERVSAYVPLVHGGWVQPGVPDDQAQPFDLALLGSSNPSGTVRVYLSRFLHVELDLTYRRGAVTADAQTPAALGDALGDLQEFSLTPRFHLVTQRQVRSGELHYFDHPAFGVLVMITPAPVEPETPGAGTPIRPAA